MNEEITNLAAELGETSSDDIDISYPKLPAANYQFKVKGATIESNKDETGQNIVIQWENENEQQTTKGETVVAGQIVLTSYVGLTKKPERVNEATNKKIRARTLQDIEKDITRVIKAVGLKCPLKDILNDPTIIVGRSAMLKIGIRKETADFPESNEIKGFVIEG